MRGTFQQVNQFIGTPPGAVFLESPLARAAGHRLQFLIAKLKGSHYISRSLGQNDLLIRLKECIQSFPGIAYDRRTASGSLEQAARRTPAALHQSTASYL